MLGLTWQRYKLQPQWVHRSIVTRSWDSRASWWIQRFSSHPQCLSRQWLNEYGDDEYDDDDDANDDDNDDDGYNLNHHRTEHHHLSPIII